MSLKKIGLSLSLITALIASNELFAAPHQTTDTQVDAMSPSRFIISVEPLYLILGGIGAKVDYAINNKFSLGVRGAFYDFHNKKDNDSSSSATNETYDVKGSEFSVGPTYMLTGDLNSDGFYTAGGVGYRKTEILNYSEFKLKGGIESPYLRATGGYQWVYSNSVRFNLGAGFQVLTGGDKEVVVKDQAGNVLLREDASSTGGLAVDIQLGLSF